MVRCEVGARMSREMHGVEYLYEARARGTRDVISLDEFYCDVSFGLLR